MNNQNSSEQFEKAGAQAAEVLGKFINFASEIGKEFNRHDPVVDGDARQRTEDELRQFGEQLRQFRESAGYTMESFSRALEEQLKNVNVADTISSVETGKSELPAHWSQAVASVLSSCDVESLFAKSGNKPESANEADNARLQRLAAIFTSDSDLDKLSDAEFDKLVAHMQNAYDSAKTLIKS